jgi:hypothetical protein
MMLSYSLCDSRAKTKTAPPKIKKDGTVTVAVSPFDGANRIRFKGSLNIAD